MDNTAPALPAAFDCTRMNLRLTEYGCAKLYRSTLKKAPQPYEGRHHCVACVTGAQHAGVTLSVVNAVVEALRPICPRCTRPTSRMIRNRLCVSCYNRDREVARGTNAKGNKPELTHQLWAVALRVLASDGAAVVRHETVIDLREGLLAAARGAKSILSFGQHCTPWPGSQASLDLDDVTLPRRMVRRHNGCLPCVSTAGQLASQLAYSDASQASQGVFL